MNPNRTTSPSTRLIARSTTLRLRPPSQYDPVAKPPPTGAMRLDRETPGVQASLETLLPGLRPDTEDATRAECPPAPIDRLASIEGISLCIGARVWTLEEIEHDCVVGMGPVCGLANSIDHIANPKRYPRIVETFAGERRERTSTPFGNDRMEFHHADPTLFGKGVEYGPQREAHTEPAHENSSPGTKARADSHPEFFFGAARPTVHEHTAVDTDQEVVRVPLSQFEDTVGTIPAIQRLPGPTHGRIGRVQSPTARPIAVSETAADSFADGCNLNDRVPL